MMNVNMLETLLSQISGALKSIRPPFPVIPAILMLCDIKNRPGLSAVSIGTSVISRLPEIGIPNETNEDGSENLINKYTMLMAEEIVKEIKHNGISQSVLEPNTLFITGEGMSSSGPITFTGSNTTFLNVRGGTM